jgi:hypothetical protein
VPEHAVPDEQTASAAKPMSAEQVKLAVDHRVPGRRVSVR